MTVIIPKKTKNFATKIFILEFHEKISKNDDVIDHLRGRGHYG